jgi:hypothetical protein
MKFSKLLTRLVLCAAVIAPLRTVAQVTSTPVVRYEAGSTIKVEQLLGEEDKERHQPTLSRTVTRYGIDGTDLGYSFERAGRVYFLFGDTLGRLDRALDTIATTDARDPERGVRLDFLTNGRDYLTIQPPGIRMGPFEVPVSGIDLGGQTYVVVSTDYTPDRTMERSVLTKFMPPARFEPLRTISRLPAGHFVKMSLHANPSPAPAAGLPPGGPYVFMWGTGVYRHSDAYLAIVPAAQFESGKGTMYLRRLDATGAPEWSDKEADAAAIVKNGTIGDLSVTWPAQRRRGRAGDRKRLPSQSGGGAGWRVRSLCGGALDEGSRLRVGPLLCSVDLESVCCRHDEVTPQSRVANS